MPKNAFVGGIKRLQNGKKKKNCLDDINIPI